MEPALANGKTSLVRRCARRAADFYFKPHFWESERLYEAVGVRVVKKLVLAYAARRGDTKEEVIRRDKLREERGLERREESYFIGERTKENLLRFERGTKLNETVHALATLVGICGTAYASLNENLGTWPIIRTIAVIAFAIGTAAQLLLTALQRYNRIRVHKWIGELDAANASETTTGAQSIVEKLN